MSELSGADFIINCAFSVTYKHIGNNQYLVDMESGQTALYSCTTSGYYGGTGQRDWNFTFVRYVESKEICTRTATSVNPTKNYQQTIYYLKEL